MTASPNKKIAENVFLWIYATKNGDLKKFDSIDIYQTLNPITNEPINQYNAISSIGLNRLVFGIENGVWYYPRNREYLIWSREDNDDKIKAILIKTLKQRAREQVDECLAIMKREHDILDIANASLLTNCILSIKKYSDVEKTVNQYFLNL